MLEELHQSADVDIFGLNRSTSAWRLSLNSGPHQILIAH